MFNALTKASSLSTAVRATTHLNSSAVNSALPTVNSIVPTKGNTELAEQCVYHQSGTLSQPSAKRSLTGHLQLRYAHTDHLQHPDFSEYRKNSAQSLERNEATAKSNENRKQFGYLMALGASIQGAIAVKNIVFTLGNSLTKSQAVLAMAKTEFELAAIPEGKTVVMSWRSKPMFVRHRTAEEIETERSVSLATLRDPQHDSDRCVRPEWLVVIGVCTHLGCVPISNAGQFGGFFCPCHGSHYDTSGRIRKGPAPLNLEVPPHSFPSDDICVVG